jgi:thioredoxin-dependent peroxiredoxin
MLTVGQKVPSFSLQNQDGEMVSLSQFKGKNLILYFYPKDDTPGCTREAIGFGALAMSFKAHNAVVLGVSRDTVVSHKKFCDKHKLEIPLLSDDSGQVTEDYGVWQEKKQYGRTYMGIVRTTYWIGPDGLVQKIWENVKVAEHPEAVFFALLDNKGA